MTNPFPAISLDKDIFVFFLEIIYFTIFFLLCSLDEG
jgi:hypothetical protein